MSRSRKGAETRWECIQGVTYNSNEMMSLGEAVTLAGLKVSSPFAPPTVTLITFGTD